MQPNRRNRFFLLSARVWLGAIAVALAASLFAIGADKSQAAFTYLPGSSPWLPLLLTPLTMASVAWITRRYFSAAEGSGIPQVIAMLKLPNTRVRRRVLSLRLALLGIASGNHVFGSGYPEARHLIEAKAELPPPEYGILKLLATLVSFLNGIPGGLFAPSLSVGAGLGANLAPLFPGLDASAVIVIGMVAYFALE